MSSSTTVVDNPKVFPQYRLTYRGGEIKTNAIAKLVLTQATVELSKIFKNKVLNSVLLSIFKAKGILQDTEAECLVEKDLTTTQWSLEFLKLLRERFDKSQALQLLCNVQDERLKEYQLEIHSAFQKDLNIPDVKVELISAENQ